MIIPTGFPTPPATGLCIDGISAAYAAAVSIVAFVTAHGGHTNPPALHSIAISPVVFPAAIDELPTPSLFPANAGDLSTPTPITQPVAPYAGPLMYPEGHTVASAWGSGVIAALDAAMTIVVSSYQNLGSNAPLTDYAGSIASTASPVVSVGQSS